MGMIGRWIDQKCAKEPDVMRRVYRRKFGDLGAFVSLDGCAGCLVGSWSIERGDQRSHFGIGPDARVGYEVAGLVDFYRWGASRSHCPKSARMSLESANQRVVRLLKQRIRKSLGIAPENRPASLRAPSRETASVDTQTVGECRFGRGE